MIKAILNSFKLIAKKPWILLPSIALYALSLAAFFLFYEQFMFAAFKQLVIEGIPVVNTWQLPLVLVKNNFADIALFGLLAMAGVFASSIVAVFYSKHAFSFSEKISSIKEDLQFTVSKWKEALIFTIVLASTMLIYLFLYYLALVFLAFNGLLLFLVIFLLFLLLVYVLLSVFLFALPALAIEELNVKQALQRSAQLFSSQPLRSVLFVTIAFIIATAIYSIGILITQQPEISAEDWLYVIVMLFFHSLTFAFTALAVSFYYIKNREHLQKQELKPKKRAPKKRK